MNKWFLRKGIKLNDSTTKQSKIISFDKHKIRRIIFGPWNDLVTWVFLYVFCSVFIPWNTKKAENGISTTHNPTGRRSSHWILASYLFIWRLWLLSTLWVNRRCRGHLQATQDFRILINFSSTINQPIFLSSPLRMDFP